MSFAPLKYAWNAITIWHFLALVVFMLPTVWSYWTGTADDRAIGSSASGVMFLTFMLCWAYFLFAPTFGQVFGDKFTFSQVWLSSIVLGLTMSAAFVSYGFSQRDQLVDSEQIGFAVFAFLFFSVFLGLVLNFFLWLLPRMAGWGAAELPKYDWAVKL